jgi:hypothetical protein
MRFGNWRSETKIRMSAMLQGLSHKPLSLSPLTRRRVAGDFSIPIIRIPLSNPTMKLAKLRGREFFNGLFNLD